MSLKSGKEPVHWPLIGPHTLVFQEAVSRGVCDEEDADAAGGGGDTDRGQETGGGWGGGGGHLHEVRCDWSRLIPDSSHMLSCYWSIVIT